MAEYEIDLKWLLDRMVAKVEALGDIMDHLEPHNYGLDVLRASLMEDITLLRQYQDVSGLPGMTATKGYA